MWSDGRIGDVELLTDLGIGQAPCDQPKPQARDLSARRALGGCRMRKTRELLDHALRYRRREKRLASSDDPDRGEQLLGRVVLEERTRWRPPERLVDVLVQVERGEDERPRRVLCGQDSPRRGVAARPVRRRRCRHPRGRPGRHPDQPRGPDPDPHGVRRHRPRGAFGSTTRLVRAATPRVPRPDWAAILSFRQCCGRYRVSVACVAMLPAHALRPHAQRAGGVGVGGFALPLGLSVFLVPSDATGDPLPVTCDGNFLRNPPRAHPLRRPPGGRARCRCTSQARGPLHSRACLDGRAWRPLLS